MGELNPVLVQQYSLSKGITFEQAKKELQADPKLAEEVQNALSNGANWGDIGDKPEFSHKNEGTENKEQKDNNWSKLGLTALAGTLVNTIGLGPILTGVAGILGVGLLSSCAGEIDVDQNVTVTIKDSKAIQEAIEKGFDALLKEIEKQGATLGDVIDLLIQQNASLKNIADTLSKQGETQKDILKVLTNINNTVNTISNLTNKISSDVEVNGKNVNEQLTKILEQLKANNLDIATLSNSMLDLKDLLTSILVNQEVSIALQGDQYKTVQDILKKLNELDSVKDVPTQLQAMLEILNSIKGIAQNIDDKLSNIQNTVNDIKNNLPNNDKIEAALQKIMEMVQKNNDKADVTNNLLKKFMEMFNNKNFGISQEDFAKLLELIAENGDKLTNIEKLLADIQKQDADFQKTMIQALATLGVEITTQLKDILAKMPNTKNIEAALNTITNYVKQNNDKADVTNSLLQKLICLYNGNGSDKGCGISQDDFAKLLELVAANGDKLTNIEKLLADIQKQDANFQKTILQALSTLGVEITTQLKDIIANMPDTTNIEAALDKITNYVKQNNDKADVTNSLLQKLICLYNGNGSGKGCGISQEDFAKLLELVAANGNKIDKTNNLLACIQNQDAKFQKAVLEALAELNGTTYETKDLVNKILNKFNNLSVGGGTVDLSNVEALLNLILQAVKDNGGKLDGIAQQNETLICILKSFKQNVEKSLNNIQNAIGDIKGDVTEVKGFLGEVNAKLAAILDRIGKGESCNLDFDKLMKKLDEILKAIQDHKVIVDTNGNVDCDCCCGSGTHEGVLDDLDNILG